MNMKKNDDKNQGVKGDEFWAFEPMILINTDRLYEIYPTNEMTLEEKLNSIVRLALYYSILMWLFTRNSVHLYVFIFVLAITYVIYKYQNKMMLKFTDDQIIEQLDSSVAINKKDVMIDREEQEFCMKPTDNNAFMNVLLTDYVDQPNRPPACSLNNPDISKMVEDKFDIGLYKDVDDIFNKNNSQREFYSNPITTIPNDREKFTDFCYSGMKSCRGGDSDKCYRYEDPRNSGGAGLRRLV
jgi:hypothetical protein